MSRKFRKPYCYGYAYGKDCRVCKYKDDCKRIMEEAKKKQK
jgi:hypothetical protein